MPGPTEEERRKINLEEVNLHTLHLSFTLSHLCPCLSLSFISLLISLFLFLCSLSFSLSLSSAYFYVIQTRRSLPIYQYRDALLEAIKDHQVCMCVCLCP